MTGVGRGEGGAALSSRIASGFRRGGIEGLGELAEELKGLASELSTSPAGSDVEPLVQDALRLTLLYSDLLKGLHLEGRGGGTEEEGERETPHPRFQAPHEEEPRKRTSEQASGPPFGEAAGVSGGAEELLQRHSNHLRGEVRTLASELRPKMDAAGGEEVERAIQAFFSNTPEASGGIVDRARALDMLYRLLLGFRLGRLAAGLREANP